ncbi:sulfotransferase family 2 domain-containing protein [Limnoglobus roseus]|uniref:Sulfotransferase family protein n=1 Tax=Limnoglobus roseus TaxID=2598579 RepID=A0A5C1ADB8_9BACT|nr:sulfotransferase family 2 domain-containing protein [Limnoglobus roseus]QEL15996.1 hypothetical protein PX52LOC_02934 [Limnoglobus roseus]
MPAESSNPPALLLFMHIPKTAGTTLRFIVEQQYRPGNLYPIYPGHREQLDVFHAFARRQLPRAVMGHFRFGLHLRLAPLSRYVTFFRDPVDQVISHYNHLLNSDRPDHREIVRPRGGLGQFLVHEWARNLQTQYVTGLSAEEIDADPDEAFHTAVGILQHHFLGFGVVEKFAASVHAMADRLGWSVPRFSALNRSAERPRRLLRKALDRCLIDRIVQANSCDVRLHAYASEFIRATSVPHFRQGLRFPYFFNVKSLLSRSHRQKAKDRLRMARQESVATIDKINSPAEMNRPELYPSVHR